MRHITDIAPSIQEKPTIHLPTRLRRLRGSPALRDLVSETSLSIRDLIFPLFIREEGNRRPIISMPGQFQLTLADLPSEIEEIVNLGIPAIILFGVPEHKDSRGSASCREEGIIQQAIRIIKDLAPNLLVMADVCLCDYTDHGHCGVIDDWGRIDNDATLEILGTQAVTLAQAGVDIVAPSGMMDGQVVAIRRALDDANFTSIPILSYSAKYCSALYAPFREAAECAPRFGDRTTYQIDYRNGDQALNEVSLDLKEGADMIMVKPAHTYLDVIYRVKKAFPGVPLAAYHTSGEFAMIKAAAINGWIDEQKVVLETLAAIKRAGADFIITYFSKQVAKW